MYIEKSKYAFKQKNIVLKCSNINIIIIKMTEEKTITRSMSVNAKTHNIIHRVLKWV